jgi:hypothetical protein
VAATYLSDDAILVGEQRKFFGFISLGFDYSCLLVRPVFLVLELYLNPEGRALDEAQNAFLHVQMQHTYIRLASCQSDVDAKQELVAYHGATG